jgi:hypothetical protein
MNTRTDPPRVFGARAAALTGLLIAIGTGGPAEVGTTGGEQEIMFIAESPNPSTCCGTPPDDPT